MTEPPLRILHLTLESAHGGVSRYLHDLCRALQQRGHHTTIAGQRGDWHDLFTGADIPWVDAPLGGGPLTLRRAAGRLQTYCRAERIDLVHAHYRKAMLVARRVARACSLPMLTTLHLTGIPMGFPWRWLTDFGDATHAPSTLARDWLVDVARVPAAQIAVIPHGVDPRKFPQSDEGDRRAARAAMNLPADATVAGYVGRFEPHKCVDWLLDVAAAMPAVRVVMMGDGPTREAVAQQVIARGLGERVTMLRYGDPMPVYRAIDALLLPSQVEGLSLVCNEAMSVGRAVGRTQTAGWHEQIIEGETGWATPVDRDAFVRAAVGRLSDAAALRRMGVAAAAHVRNTLTFDRQIEQTIAWYRKCLGG